MLNEKRNIIIIVLLDILTLGISKFFCYLDNTIKYLYLQIIYQGYQH